MAASESSAKRARIPQRGPQPPRYIVIEGPLRVGKTTLARLLAERLSRAPHYDCEDNPFWLISMPAFPGPLPHAIVFPDGTAEAHS